MVWFRFVIKRFILVSSFPFMVWLHLFFYMVWFKWLGSKLFYLNGLVVLIHIVILRFRFKAKKSNQSQPIPTSQDPLPSSIDHEKSKQEFYQHVTLILLKTCENFCTPTLNRRATQREITNTI